MRVTVLRQARGVTEIVIVMVDHQMLGVDVMTVDVMTVGVTTVGVMTVGVTGGVTTVAVTTIVDVMIVAVMIVAVMIVAVMIVVVMTVDVTSVTNRWLGEDVTGRSVTVHQVIRGVVIAGPGIGMIVTVATVKESALEEAIVMIGLAGGVSAQMTVIHGEEEETGEEMSRAVISGDEIHRLLHALKVC